MSGLLEGKNVVIVVFAPSYTSLHKRLTAQGGHNKKTVTRTTDLVVSNGKECPALERARALGIHIITQHDFELMLQGTPLPDDVDDEESSSVEEAFGKIRSVMAEGADSWSTWRCMIDVLDECEPQRREALLIYIEAAMERAMQEQPFDGYFGSQGGSGAAIRAWGSMPPAWLGAMGGHERSQKYRLVRELDLYGSTLGVSLLNKLLTHPDLARLSRVRLVHNKVPSKRMLKTLCQHTSTATVEHLGLGRMNVEMAEILEKEGSEARALRTLDLSSLQFWGRQESAPPAKARLGFLKSPYFSTIEALVMPPLREYRQSSWLLDTLAEASLCPRLRTLRFTQANIYLMEHLAEDLLKHSGLGERIERLDIGDGWWSRHDIEESLVAFMRSSPQRALRHLSLSDYARPTYENGSSFADGMRPQVDAILLEHLPGSPLLSTLNTLELGRWATTELKDAIHATKPELEVC